MTTHDDASKRFTYDEARDLMPVDQLRQASTERLLAPVAESIRAWQRQLPLLARLALPLFVRVARLVNHYRNPTDVPT